MSESSFTLDELNQLENEVKRRLTPYRFNHTLGVARAAERLGQKIMPERCSELIVAALLHDIAKELDEEQTLSLLQNSDLPISDEDLDIKPALHSISGAEIIKRDFSRFATHSVINAVYNHTVGAPDMDLFSEIIFVSDYIEEGRSYYYSKEVSNFIFSQISDENIDITHVLHQATRMILSHTVDSLIKKSKPVHSRAYLTKSRFDSLI